MVAIERLDTNGLLGLLQRTDKLGVVSVYLNTDFRNDPSMHATTVDLKNRFRGLQRGIAGDAEHGDEVAAALERLWPKIEQLPSPPASDRSRIAFAALENDWLVQLESAMPVPNRVVFDSRPVIHPLLELLDAGRAAGVVLVSAERARLLEWRVGSLQTLRRMQRQYVEASHERSRQLGGGPAGQFHSPMREQHQARERDQAERFLDQVATATTELADERGWQRLVVSGGDRWTAPTIAKLPPTLRDTAVADTRVLTGVDDVGLAGIVTEWIDEQHSRRGEQLLRQVHDAAGAGVGVFGLSAVAAALNAGRVAHFVYDPKVRYTGTVGADGALYGREEADPNGQVGRFEPRLTERLVEQALKTGAQVSPVDGGANGQLRQAAGIAALLRW